MNKLVVCELSRVVEVILIRQSSRTETEKTPLTLVKTKERPTGILLSWLFVPELSGPTRQDQCRCWQMVVAHYCTQSE